MSAFSRAPHSSPPLLGNLPLTQTDLFCFWPARPSSSGLYYHHITPHIIVGTQPRVPVDIDYLHDNEGVTVILSVSGFSWKTTCL